MTHKHLLQRIKSDATLQIPLLLLSQWLRGKPSGVLFFYVVILEPRLEEVLLCSTWGFRDRFKQCSFTENQKVEMHGWIHVGALWWTGWTWHLSPLLVLHWLELTTQPRLTARRLGNGIKHGGQESRQSREAANHLCLTLIATQISLSYSLGPFLSITFSVRPSSHYPSNTPIPILLVSPSSFIYVSMNKTQSLLSRSLHYSRGDILVS